MEGRLGLLPFIPSVMDSGPLRKLRKPLERGRGME